VASLRDQLWTEIFRLFSALLSRTRGFEVVRDALSVRGAWPYFTTLAAAVQNDLSTDLRYSALTSLTLLLSHEIRMRSMPEESCCVQNLLDGDFPVPEQSCHSAPCELLSACGDTRSDGCGAVFQDGELVAHRKAPESEECRAPCSAHEQPSASKSKCDSGASAAGREDHFSSSEESEEKLASGTSRSAALVGGEAATSGTQGGTAKRHTVAEDLCKSLLCLYERHNLPQGSRDKSSGVKAKSLVTSALSSLLAVSGGAKSVALKRGLLEMLVVQLRELHMKLSVESAEKLRRKSDKKRVSRLHFPVAHGSVGMRSRLSSRFP
jgi:hypothetical protein